MSRTKESKTLLPVGEKVFVRTVTHYHTGRLVDADDSYVLLDDAAWIASTGKWSEALASGKLEEVEPFPSSCLINRGAIVDICPWIHPLPREAV